jgi:hypothetical protein
MIRIPEPISSNTALTFRWFVEYIIDNSPKFTTTSAIAKAANILNADLDTPGLCELPADGLKLIREALLSEDPPLALPELVLQTPEGQQQQKVPARIYHTYINALLLDVTAEDTAASPPTDAPVA